MSVATLMKVMSSENVCWLRVRSSIKNLYVGMHGSRWQYVKMKYIIYELQIKELLT